MKNTLFFSLLILFFALACTSTKPTSTTSKSVKKDPSKELVFEDSERLAPVLEKAQKQKKPVFLVFYATWCMPCKVMEEEVFTNQQTFTYLNKNFLNQHTDVDSESGKLLAGIYEISALPTVLFLDTQGVVLERHVGIAQSSDIIRMGDLARAKVK